MEPLERIVACLVASALMQCAPAAMAQPPSDAGAQDRPPGMGRDASRPSENAIHGGAEVPSAAGGIPDAEPRGRPSQHSLLRCRQLSGLLRDQCLRELGASSGAGTRPPEGSIPGPVGRDPITAPPPQNPR